MEQVTVELGVYLRGWKEYFKLADTPWIFADLDGWIHRRLRALQLKQWKQGRTTFRELHARGLPKWLIAKGAGHSRRWWWAVALGAMQTALPGSYFDRLGVPRLAAPPLSRLGVAYCNNRPLRCNDTVLDRGGEALSYCPSLGTTARPAITLVMRTQGGGP